MKRFGILIALALSSQIGAQEKPRVYVGATPTSWHSSEGATSRSKGENRSLEISRNMHKNKDCQGVTLTNRLQKADYVVEATRRKQNIGVAQLNRTEVAVYRSNGDLIFSDSKGSVGAAAQAACEAVRKDMGSSKNP